MSGEVKGRIVKINGKEMFKYKGMYLPIDKFEMVGKNRVPVVKAEAREIKHPDGSQDVIVSVPTVKIRGTSKSI